MKEEYYFPSADDITQIHVCVWKPEKDPVAVLQIAHGMKEYIDRYEEFAEAMNEQGILVIGNDHLGHGKSVSDEYAYGYFGKKLGPDQVLADMQSVREKAEEKHPGVPGAFRRDHHGDVRGPGARSGFGQDHLQGARRHEGMEILQQACRRAGSRRIQQKI